MRRRWRTLGILLAVIGGSSVLSGGNSNVSVPAERLIQFLNESISLYHQTTIQEHSATNSQEQVLLYDNSQLASESARLAFDFARAQLDAMSGESLTSLAAPPGATSSQYHTLRQMLVTLDKQLQDTQAESDSDRRKLSTATGVKHSKLQAEISELQGEIALAQARRDAVRSMLDFVGGSTTANLTVGGLRAQVEAMASSIPTVSANTRTQDQQHVAVEFPASSNQPAPSGIWGYSSDLLALYSRLRAVSTIAADTNILLQTSDQLRAPFT